MGGEGEESSWVIYKDEPKLGNLDTPSSSSSACTSSIGEESMDDDGSSSNSSSDIADDASSASPSSSNSYDLSEIMAQLPIKRGLSKFYQGKSESFTSLSRVTSSEDLAKKIVSPYRRNYSSNSLKASKSFATGLNSYKPYTLPKAVITKKSRISSFSSFGNDKRGSFLITSNKPPMVPLHSSNLGC